MLLVFLSRFGMHIQIAFLILSIISAIGGLSTVLVNVFCGISLIGGAICDASEHAMKQYHKAIEIIKKNKE